MEGEEGNDETDGFESVSRVFVVIRGFLGWSRRAGFDGVLARETRLALARIDAAMQHDPSAKTFTHTCVSRMRRHASQLRAAAGTTA
jgi:hypothetical protein